MCLVLAIRCYQRSIQSELSSHCETQVEPAEVFGVDLTDTIHGTSTFILTKDLCGFEYRSQSQCAAHHQDKSQMHIQEIPIRFGEDNIKQIQAQIQSDTEENEIIFRGWIGFIC